MKALRFFACLCLSVLSVAAATPALGLANRVFVSARSGNNANSCDNILTPCQTFAGAVLQLNPGGEAIVLDSGGYGPVTITQSVTIEAPPGITAFIHPPSGDAITVSAGASDKVTLRGLTLNVGTGNGITFSGGGRLVVDRCSISGFNNYAIAFTASGTLVLTDTEILNSYDGILNTSASGAQRLEVLRCRFENNSNRGIALYANVPVSGVIVESKFSGSIAAVEINPSPASPAIVLSFERTTFVNNGDGVYAGGAGTVARVANSTVVRNDRGLVAFGILSRGDNTVRDNTSCDLCSISGTYAPN